MRGRKSKLCIICVNDTRSDSGLNFVNVTIIIIENGLCSHLLHPIEFKYFFSEFYAVQKKIFSLENASAF